MTRFLVSTRKKRLSCGLVAEYVLYMCEALEVGSLAPVKENYIRGTVLLLLNYRARPRGELFWATVIDPSSQVSYVPLSEALGHQQPLAS